MVQLSFLPTGDHAACASRQVESVCLLESFRSGAMATKKQKSSSGLLQCCSIVLRYGCAATLIRPVKSPNFQGLPVFPT